MAPGGWPAARERVAVGVARRQAAARKGFGARPRSGLARAPAKRHSCPPNARRARNRPDRRPRWAGAAAEPRPNPLHPEAPPGPPRGRRRAGAHAGAVPAGSRGRASPTGRTTTRTRTSACTSSDSSHGRARIAVPAGPVTSTNRPASRQLMDGRVWVEEPPGGPQAKNGRTAAQCYAEASQCARIQNVFPAYPPLFARTCCVTVLADICAEPPRLATTVNGCH